MGAEDLVAVIRDLSIIVFTTIGVVTMLVTTTIGLLLYRKMAPTIDSARATMKSTQEATSQLSDKVVKPLISASTMAYSAGRVVAFILGLSRNKGGKSNGT